MQQLKLNWLLFPYHQSTLVSNHSQKNIHYKLQNVIRTSKQPRSFTLNSEAVFLGRKSKDNFKFEGQLSLENFHIALISYSPEHFMPYIRGRVEATSLGSIIFTTYYLPQGTLFLAALATLVFWSCAGVFFLIQGSLLIASLFLLSWLLAYGVMMANFKQKVKLSQEQLQKAWQ